MSTLSFGFIRKNFETTEAVGTVQRLEVCWLSGHCGLAIALCPTGLCAAGLVPSFCPPPPAHPRGTQGAGVTFRCDLVEISYFGHGLREPEPVFFSFFLLATAMWLAAFSCCVLWLSCDIWSHALGDSGDELKAGAQPKENFPS